MRQIAEEEFLSGKHDAEIRDLLAAGGIVVFPSENSYGFAGNALDHKVAKRIHDAKKEPHDKPLGLITDSVSKVEAFLEIGWKGRMLLEARLSGPLTVLFREKKGAIARIPCSTNGLVGVRIPQKKSLVHLCSLVAFPLTAPSANIHGKPAIYDSEEVKRAFGKEDFVLIDAGKLDEAQMPSTYYNLEEGKVLRQGKVTLEEIGRVFGKS